jgi:hypothetical protein
MVGTAVPNVILFLVEEVHEAAGFRSMDLEYSMHQEDLLIVADVEPEHCLEMVRDVSFDIETSRDVLRLC